MKNDSGVYIIHSDGGSRGNPGEAAYGFIVYNSDKQVMHTEGKRIGIATNNIAEYRGVIGALEWAAKQTGNKSIVIHFFLDSKLVVSQLNGIYKIKNENLRLLSLRVKNLQKKIPGPVFYTAIPRKFNREADRLVNMALDSEW